MNKPIIVPMLDISDFTNQNPHILGINTGSGNSNNSLTSSIFVPDIINSRYLAKTLLNKKRIISLDFEELSLKSPWVGDSSIWTKILKNIPFRLSMKKKYLVQVEE